MPPKRRRAKGDGDGEASSQVKQSDASAKRRKKQEDESDKTKDSTVRDMQKDETDNGKTSKGRKGKRNKRARDPSVERPDSAVVATERVVGSSIVGRKTKDKETVKGTNKSRSNNRPRQGADMITVEKLVSHFSHLKTPGSILIMGQGDFGQLGLGEGLTERKKPYPVKGELSNKKVVQVKCGGMHTAALTADGKVYTWGCNDEGSLGYSMTDGEVFEPRQVKSLEGVNIIQISAGDCHTTALTDNGNVYCWGVFRDSNGPFGMVNSSPSIEPQLVYSSPYNPAVKVVSGDNHVLILTEEGTVFSFGSGEQGQLGRVPEVFCSRGGRQGLNLFFTPQSVRLFRKRSTAMPKFIDIFAGSYNSFAVAEEERCIYVWGLNNYSQLGVGSNEIEFYPIKVPDDWLWSWGARQRSSAKTCGLAIAGGMHHTLVSDSGSVYSMGSKNYGRLGLGKVDTEPERPTEVTSIKDVVGVACGGSCSFAVSLKGDVFSWGMGSTLQLGQADDEDYWEPTKITGKNLENKKVIGVSSGGQHTALLVTNSEMD